MSLDILSKDTGGSYSDDPGYFVGGSRYGSFFAIPFRNNRNCPVILKSLTLPLAYWSQNGNARTVQGAVWLSSNGPIGGGSVNVMNLYDAAKSNLSALRNKNNGSVSGSKGYEYWYSPWQGLGYSDKQKVLEAMLYSTNTCTPNESVDRGTTTRVREYTFYFNNIEIPSGTYFYVGIYGSESACEGNSIAIRRLGYSSTNRNGSLDQKFNYERNTMVACNYVTDYRGRWHFYNGYFTSNGHVNNYAQGTVDAKITVESKYSIPTISITSSGTTTRHDVSVTINYSDNTASGDKGSTVVQYSINGGSWNNVPGSGNSAGSFSYVPSSYGVQTGARYSVKARRVCTSSDFDNVSENSEIIMNTYKSVTMTGFSLSPASIVNANIPTTLSWNSFSSDEATTCKIEVLNSSGSVISTIASELANNITSKVFTPSNNIGITYDNTNVTLRITRTGSSSKYTASQTLTFRILYRPTDKVTNINPGSLGIIKDNKNVTWGYPGGYKGIVSGYNVTLTSSNGHVVNYDALSNNVVLKITDINPAVWYRIGIRAYYKSDNNYYYGPYNEISNYLYLDKGIAVPTITYPVNSSWIGNTYRVIFQLPEDYNYEFLSQEIKNNYRYHDVEVNINDKAYTIKNYPNAFSLISGNLTHKEYIVFSAQAIGIPANPTNNIKVRVLSYFDTWSGYSNTVTMKNISNAKSKNIGDIIYFDDYNSILSVAQSLCKSYGISLTTSSKKGSPIVSGDINNVYSKLLEMKNKVNNNYTYNNQSVKFKDISPIIVSKGDIIRASHFAHLVSIISTLTT